MVTAGRGEGEKSACRRKADRTVTAKTFKIQVVAADRTSTSDG